MCRPGLLSSVRVDDDLMDEHKAEIECQRCQHVGTVADTTGYACPSCGSMAGFDIRVVVSDRLEVHDQRKTRQRAKSKKDSIDILEGDDYYRRLGRWSTLLRIVDRRHDHYLERIADKVSGKVYQDKDELLSEHRQQQTASAGYCSDVVTGRFDLVLDF